MTESLALMLSLLALVLFGLLVADLVRRPARSFGPLRLAGRTLAPAWTRRAWAVALAVSFAAGFYGLPVTRRTEVRQGDRPAAAPVGRESRSVLRLPFLVREARVATTVDGTFLRSVRTTRTQLPWAFALVALLYAWRVMARGGASGPAETRTPGEPRTVSPPSGEGGGRR